MLGELVPVLAKVAANKFLPRLCGWLRDAILLKNPNYAEQDDDHSYIWRPAIEDHEQNQDRELVSILVGFVRQACEVAIRDGSLSLAQVLELVQAAPGGVFRRIRIHLVDVFADQSPELARNLLMDSELRDDHRYKHEYAMLAEHRFGLLTPQERGEWFAWLDEGPPMEGFEESVRSITGKEPTELDRENRIRYWKFSRLHWIRQYLVEGRREFYEQMLAEHGVPEMATMSFRVGVTRWGSESPMKLADLAAQSFQDAVESVSAWRPAKREFDGPNVEGLASTFTEYVASHVQEFSGQASHLINRPAIFVRGFISQMAKAVKEGKQIALAPVLGLCEWVVGRPCSERTTFVEGETDWGVDQDWQWTREEIAQLIQNACAATADSRPLYAVDQFRLQLWRVLHVMGRDRAESHVVHDVTKDDPRVRDYLDLGINSPRGKVVEAVLEYARWVAKSLTTPQQQAVPGGFDAMPEVRTFLEWLVSEDHQTVAVQAVVGSQLPSIYWIDKAWLGSRADLLFGTGTHGAPATAAQWAAWNAFVVWVQPHIEYFELFRKQFIRAVREASQVTVADGSREQPMNRLGEHLMVLYLRGQLGLDDHDGLLRCFLLEAVADIRRHAIGFVGQILDSDEDLPGQMIERCQHLWDVYWPGRGKEDATDRRHGWSFGLWFASGRLPPLWALEQLDAYIQIMPTPEPDGPITEQLAQIADVDLARAMRILDRLIRSDREGWRVEGWVAPAKLILGKGLAAGGESRTTAERLIDHLGRCGYLAFGDLLSGR